jgi:putative membrane protein
MNVSGMLQNPYVLTTAFFAVTILALIIFLTAFELVTRYHAWKEIKEGNLSVAMAVGGKIFGISNIFRSSIEQNDTIGQSLIWGGFGFLLLLIAYFIFEFMTPKFKIDQEIENDNRAVGLLSMMISIGLSYVIGASIV